MTQRTRMGRISVLRGKQETHEWHTVQVRRDVWQLGESVAEQLDIFGMMSRQARGLSVLQG